MKAFFLSSVLFVSAFNHAIAQAVNQSGDPHTERFMSEARKSPALTKFYKELNSLTKSAKGRTNNASSVRALFARNAELLKDAYQKTGVPAPTPLGASKFKVHTPEYAISKSVVASNAKILTTALPFSKTGGYDFSWERSEFPNGNMPKPFDTTGSSVPSGKQIITSKDNCTSPSYCHLGVYQRGFGEFVTVPSNPQIIAAVVKFDYSFDYDAWDSYGAQSSIDLLVRAGPNFASSSYNELPDATSISSIPADRWKSPCKLMTQQYLITDFGEFHAQADTSVTIEGYVTPGSTLDLRIGFGFTPGAHRGLNGSYHYAEFILKRISVTYYKTAQQ